MTEKLNPDEPPRFGHEPDLRGMGRVLAASTGLVLLVALGLVLVYGVLSQLSRQTPSIEPASLVQLPPAKIPAPRLNSDQPRELQAVRQREEALLNGYQWVDREQGVARIPIERAMAIIAERGLPAGENLPAEANEEVPR